ncbi:hypothetical protein CC1G_09520 [Coprinopsis cinerea okayama7|uniref:Uncharacterized protein n=1 Tax=Coprinopsis cinerea (strain Okayama-7 / 130 / ATCC MYA-4618 / FGSC 9003) TaxID=240176 RepID=A8P0U7_COPC7|nr:hypothetical protein CC1G_09520 [Coprinopsis cinerea okayama7\|eukprot:XP_001837969.2 hypothetical protein CC1G_09520 [Coprinopsis cinerea okayama7\
MSISSHLPILNFIKYPEEVKPFGHPKERQIDRKILIDISPDREDYLRRRSIEELRDDLKIRPDYDEEQSNWLYQRVGGSPRSDTTKINDCDSTEGHQLKANSTTRLLNFDDTILSSRESSRRLSAFWIRNRCSVSLESLNFSDVDTLVSPRPLGPTHILVAYESRCTGFRPRVCEMPINDLLFVLNTPNLGPRRSDDGLELPPLPKRMQDELPRVVMPVPQLETLPELVIYLHNKNQAELFRRLVPVWIRDILHPMPSVVVQDLDVGPDSVGWSCIASFRLPWMKPGWKNQTRLAPGKPFSQRRTETVAAELAATARSLKQEQKAILTLVKLNALRENLQYVGYFVNELWVELDMTREVLLKAISYMSKVEPRMT